MILRHEGSRASTSAPVPAWDAILRSQQAPGASSVVMQNDHAQLAGELAMRLDPAAVGPEMPAINSVEARAIALHDAGWAAVDAEYFGIGFMSHKPEQHMRAATGSIEIAERESAVAGWLVSKHFTMLARFNPSNTPGLEPFIEQEDARRERLLTGTGHPLTELERLYEVLRWCDLVSLYLCCGTAEAIELPAICGGRAVNVQAVEDTYHFSPFPFLGKGEAHVTAYGIRDRRPHGLTFLLRGAELR